MIQDQGRACGITYCGFVDPAGGFGGDAMAMAIGHYDMSKQTIFVDCLREQRPPFSPEAVIEEFAKTLHSYHINKVFGDRYAGGFPPEQFQHFSILFEQSAKPKSDLYVDLLPTLNSRRIQLLDNQRLVAQLCSLERRTTRGSGRDVVDHPPNGRDDLANCVAGLASICLAKPVLNLDIWDIARPDTPTRKRGWQLANFKSEAEAEAYKAQMRKQFGLTCSFPWDF